MSDQPSRRRRRRLYPLTGIAVAATIAALSGARTEQASTPLRAGGGEEEVERKADASDERDRPDRSRSIEWRRSVPLGTYSAGSLRRGVRLPAEGRAWVSWDPILKQRPNRQSRRWGTDRLVRTTLRIVRGYAAEHPNAPRVAIGDLSRPSGGDFGPRFGYPGHASHQIGLDIDVYYPRTDRRVRPPGGPADVDLRLAQDLVDRWVDAGAERVFVGPSLGLDGPAGVVEPLVNHDDHLHARLPLP